MVAGLGVDGKAYVLEDATMKGSPAQWGAMVASAYKRWGADSVIAEVNFGGAMVKAVIGAAMTAAGVTTWRYQEVTASRQGGAG